MKIKHALVLATALFTLSPSGYAESGDSFTTDKWLAALDSKNPIDVVEAQGFAAGVIVGFDADIGARNAAGGYKNNVFCVTGPMSSPALVNILRPVIESRKDWRDQAIAVSVFLAAKIVWPCSGANL